MLDIDFNKLINWQYVTDKPSSDIFHLSLIVSVITSATCLGVIFWLVRKWKLKSGNAPISEPLRQASMYLFYPAILGLLMIFLRVQNLSFPLWRLLMLILLIIWIILILYVLQYAAFGYPLAVKSARAKALKEKYLPKQKKIGR